MADRGEIDLERAVVDGGAALRQSRRAIIVVLSSSVMDVARSGLSADD
jgi:hypothetical protein